VMARALTSCMDRVSATEERCTLVRALVVGGCGHEAASSLLAADRRGVDGHPGAALSNSCVHTCKRASRSKIAPPVFSEVTAHSPAHAQPGRVDVFDIALVPHNVPTIPGLSRRAKSAFDRYGWRCHVGDTSVHAASAHIRLRFVFVQRPSSTRVNVGVVGHARVLL